MSLEYQETTIEDTAAVLATEACQRLSSLISVPTDPVM